MSEKHPLSYLFEGWRQLAAYSSLAWVYFTPVHAKTLGTIKQIIRKKFPEVRQISTADLAAWLADTNRPSPRLIDARTKKEFAVSHLRDASHVTSVAELESLQGADNQALVVYCSIGYRSSAFAHKLQRAGFTNVFNLEGAIFQWANEGRPVYCGSHVVHAVHPFNRKWGKLLNGTQVEQQ